MITDIFRKHEHKLEDYTVGYLLKILKIARNEASYMAYNYDEGDDYEYKRVLNCVSLIKKALKGKPHYFRRGDAKMIRKIRGLKKVSKQEAEQMFLKGVRV